jgi:putative Mn2+ efflux pump MntP
VQGGHKVDRVEMSRKPDEEDYLVSSAKYFFLSVIFFSISIIIWVLSWWSGRNAQTEEAGWGAFLGAIIFSIPFFVLGLYFLLKCIFLNPESKETVKTEEKMLTPEKRWMYSLWAFIFAVLGILIISPLTVDGINFDLRIGGINLAFYLTPIFSVLAMAYGRKSKNTLGEVSLILGILVLIGWLLTFF